MITQSSGNGHQDGSIPATFVGTVVEEPIVIPAGVVRKSRNKRARPTLPRQNHTVSLVIPARNEARNIAWVLEQIADDVDEIVLVDGHSTDATLIAARRYRPRYQGGAPGGRRQGSALRTGFLAATGDIIVMMDADAAWPPRRSVTTCISFTTDTTSSRGHASPAAEGRSI